MEKTFTIHQKKRFIEDLKKINGIYFESKDKKTEEGIIALSEVSEISKYGDFNWICQIIMDRKTKEWFIYNFDVKKAFKNLEIKDFTQLINLIDWYSR